MDQRFNAIVLHDSLHGCRNSRGTGAAIIEAKLAQQLAHLEHQPFFGIFLDLQKDFDTMDCEMSPNLRGLWHRPEHDFPHKQLLGRGDYGMSGLGELWEPFQASHGVMQGGPLSVKLFNILVDAVVQELIRALQEDGDYEEEELGPHLSTFFAIFMSKPPILLRVTPSSSNSLLTCSSTYSNKQAYKQTLGRHTQ